MSGWLALAVTLVVVGGVADAPGLMVVAAITAGYGTLTRLWTRYGVRSVDLRAPPRRVARGGG